MPSSSAVVRMMWPRSPMPPPPIARRSMSRAASASEREPGRRVVGQLDDELLGHGFLVARRLAGRVGSRPNFSRRRCVRARLSGPRGAGSRCTAGPTGAPRGAPRDRASAGRQTPKVPIVEASERRIDRLELAASLGREGRGRAAARRPRWPWPPGSHRSSGPAPRVGVGDLLEQALTLGQERVAEAGRPRVIHRAHRAPTTRRTGRRYFLTSQRRLGWRARRDSNPRPSAPEAAGSMHSGSLSGDLGCILELRAPREDPVCPNQRLPATSSSGPT